MQVKKVISAVLTSLMLFSLSSFPVFAADTSADSKPGIAFEAPLYNAVKNVYEVSKPEHIMYMSGDWKDGAPRDGHYVLTTDIDMSAFEDFIPIASEKEAGFIGTFDGQFHMIKNLKVHYPKKYVGLFGYIGNENQPAYIKNLALINCDIIGQQNVGGLTGVNYGTITNCVVTGKIVVDNLSNSHTGGAVAGKVKEGEGPVMGRVENCFINADIIAPYDVGGIAGIQDGGGYIGKCFALGTVTSNASNGMAGGIVGSFNAGDRLENCVAAQSVITGVRDTDRIVGQLNDESGININNNYAWEGTQMIGNGPVERPNRVYFEPASTEKICSKETYLDLGWDFSNVWDWKTTATGGYPMLKGFSSEVTSIAANYVVKSTNIISSPMNTAKLHEKTMIAAKVLSPETVNSVSLYYGYDPDGTKFTDHVKMNLATDGRYTAQLPTDKAEYVYYYIKAETAAGTVTYPYYSEFPVSVYVDDGRILGEPSQITMTVGSEQGSLRFSWLTVPEIDATVIKYKIKGSSEWTSKEGKSFLTAVTKGWKEKNTHQVTLEDLKPDAIYVYSVGDGKTFMSPEKEFKAPSDKAADAFSFLFVSDPQSVSTEDYESFQKSMDFALTKLEKMEFFLTAGDITQDGYKSSEWDACFEVMGDYFSKYPSITIPGNHEMKGDWNFINFAGRFNLPGGDAGTSFDNTIGAMEYGDACFVIINTEVTPPAEKPEILQKQLDWAKACFEQSNKKWRIMVAHAGPYTSNHDPMEVRPYLIDAIDDMKVDLFLNGHDHIYIRGTVKNDQKVPLGEGTTYITGGTVGNKYYDYLDRSKYFTDSYHDDEDQQTVNLVTVSKDGIKVTSMQKADPENWETWKLADEFVIPKSLSSSGYKEAGEGTGLSIIQAPADAGTLSMSSAYYTVVPGDVLWKIALKYNWTWKELAEINHLLTPDLIYPGQKIRIQ
ncbi:LysM peptidoglycan-binding domain-containing protein [Anoxybacterium hadale]|uniref:LysM peptidoglycan-binding domain-containing protein n=1 Tax=Anoxybacterium hadale TaxID=3408580 RepID=A0ACD1AA10_9FIRM|nr:LysM peptidoglycan-binding domain-containing protein [Clostridiales bacterium]